MSFTDEQIARIAHEANRALQQVLGDDQVSPPWDQASQHDKDMSAAGAKIARHGASPEVLHDSWMRDKLAAGWVHGEIKDATAKTHPLLVPFDELPPGDRAKDYLFAGVCAAMNKAADVVTRAENEARALAESARVTANQALSAGDGTFGGRPPIPVQLPQPPATAPASED